MQFLRLWQGSQSQKKGPKRGLQSVKPRHRTEDLLQKSPLKEIGAVLFDPQRQDKHLFSEHRKAKMLTSCKRRASSLSLCIGRGLGGEGRTA